MSPFSSCGSKNHALSIAPSGVARDVSVNFWESAVAED